MAYYTDGNGNYYCGQFSSQINYSYNTSDLNTNNLAGTLRTDLTTIFGLLNYRFFNFAGTWTDGIALASTNLISWKTANDPITSLVKRSTINSHPNNSTNSHFNDAGGTALLNSNAGALGYQSYIVNQYGITLISHTVSSFTTADYRLCCLTELIDVNDTIPTNSSIPYYSSFYKNSLLLLQKTSITTTSGLHYVEQTNTSNKPILLTADAVYGITCNDGQTAGSDLWMTKLHVFDNTLRSDGVNSKYSRIGTVPNIAIGIGTSWVIGRIYSPAVSLFPGNNKWLCVGNWNGLSNRFILVNVWSLA
jgi:hypothetical protein